MSINDILMDEQLTIMRYAAAIDTADIRVHSRKLSLFGSALADYPYPHRPYAPANVLEHLPRQECAPVPPTAQLSRSAVAAWENEGGHL